MNYNKYVSIMTVILSFTSALYSSDNLDEMFKYRYIIEIDSIANPDCTTDFFTISRDNIIQLWSLENDSIYGGDTILIAPEDHTSVSFGGDVECPTFYTSRLLSGIKYYDALLGWIEIPTSTALFNQGSHENDHYFMSFTLSDLYYFDGNDFSIIATENPSKFLTRDIAVDTLGRAWVLVGEEGENTNVLNAYDRNGLIQSYDLSYIGGGKYGSFFLNDILYIGMSDSGPYANSIIPITIVEDTVQLGTPIPFMHNEYSDMASCQWNKINTATNIINISSETFSIFPNPTNSIININSNFKELKIEIYNSSGILQNTSYNNSFKSIDLSFCPSGVYTVVLFTENRIYSKRVIKHKLD